MLTALPRPQSVATGLPVSELLAGVLGRMPLDLALGIVVQTARLLERAHAQGHVHGGFSLAALWVSTSGDVWLEWHPQTSPKHRALPPEIRAGQPPTAASDVYALGAATYELLTGLSVSRAWAKAPLVPLQSVASPAQFSPRVSYDVDTLVSRSLSRHIADRPGNVGELAAACEGALAGRAWHDGLAALLADPYFAAAVRDLPVTCERTAVPVPVPPPPPPRPPQLVSVPALAPDVDDEGDTHVRSSVPFVKILLLTLVAAAASLALALGAARTRPGEGGRVAQAAAALVNAPRAVVAPVVEAADWVPETVLDVEPAKVVKAKKVKAERPHTKRRSKRR
ncbi:MAG: hypothetical protein JNK82_25845 [Myxococcaceae bacterium]|nr:hypothetical protein [Myxococcaceae bacterium]